MPNTSGFTSNKNPSTTDWEEHGATGDVSTGRRLKYVQEVPLDTLIDEVDANTTYVGQASYGTATSSPLWRIKKITISGSITTIRFADNGRFTQVWDDRASLSY